MPPRSKSRKSKLPPAPPTIYAFGEGESAHTGVFTVVGGRVEKTPRPTSAGYLFKGACTEEGVRSGEGVEVFPNGAYYEGSFQNQAKSGHGKLVFADGSVFVGDFDAGKMHGKGVLTTETATYTGEWRGGHLNGHATVEDASGLTCKGEFKDGMRHGICKVVYPSGLVYEGEWVNDKRHGHGRQVWPNGLVYEGGWENGVQHGEGSFTYPSGKVQAAVWKEGKLTERR